MGILMPSGPGAVPGPESPALEEFARHYGYHGYICDYRTGAVLEAHQLDFMRIDHYPGQGGYGAIPAEERSAYWKAVVDAGLGWAVTEGGAYTVPAGDRKWHDRGTLEHARIVSDLKELRQ